MGCMTGDKFHPNIGSPVVENTTSLEQALAMAEANEKQAKRLLDDAKKKFAAGDIPQSRLDELQRLYDTAVEDHIRTNRES